MKPSPEFIGELKENEVFVFGSNADGFHGAGAARTAHKQFGALWSQGNGLQGQSYAIDTMSGYEEMKKRVQEFIHFAEENPHLDFLVTEIGCGIAGYHVYEVALLFAATMQLPNIYLPQRFINTICSIQTEK